MSNHYPKYAIECQHCKDSLTIVYSVHEPEVETDDAVKKHLVFLMDQHLKNHPGNHDPLPPGVPNTVQEWIQKLRPAQKPA